MHQHGETKIFLSVFIDPSKEQSVFENRQRFDKNTICIRKFCQFCCFLQKLHPVTDMDDAELVRIVDALDLNEEDVDSDDQLFAPSRLCARRIYSDSESSEEVSQDEANESDSEESLRNFSEVTVENDRQYIYNCTICNHCNKGLHGVCISKHEC